MDVPGREAREARIARQVASTLRGLMRRFLDLMGDPPHMEFIPQTFWDESTLELSKTLMPLLQDVYQDQALELTGTLPIGVDWALINEAAANWAKDYTFELVKKIDDTTRKTLQSAVSAFFEQGLTRAQLEARISPIWGPVRAEMIAVTEVTRAATEGERQVARELEKYGITMVPYWGTKNDEIVCPLCGPRNRQEITDGVFPPMHVRCRCHTNYKLPKMTAEEPEAVTGVRVPPTEAEAARARIAKIDKRYSKQMERLSAEKEDISKQLDTFAKRCIELQYGTPEYDEAATGVNTMMDKLDAVRKKLAPLQERRDAAALREIQVANPTNTKPAFADRQGFYDPGGLSRSAADRKSIKAGFNEFSKLTSESLYPGADIRYISTRWPDISKYAGRGYHNMGNIYLPEGVRPRLVIHELGHELEFRNAEVHKKAVAFLERRTVGEEARKLRDIMKGYDYGEDEIAKKDKFFDPYCGKIYETAGEKRSTEIVSMGMERMYVDPIDFARTDPDYFDFIYDLLRGM